MENGIAARLGTFLVALLFAPTAGCDSSAASAQPPRMAAAAPAPQPAKARLGFDRARNRIWLLTAEGVFVVEAGKGAKTQVSLPGWLWAGTPYGCLPDLALGPKGEVIVTSDVLPTLWRIDPETLSVSVHPLALDADTDKDVGFSELAYSAKHGAYFAVSHAQGSLWRIGPSLRRAQKTPLSAPAQQGCGQSHVPSESE